MGSSMLVTTLTVSSKGQIALPREFLEDLGVGRGDKLFLVQHEGRLVIRSAAGVARDEWDDVEGWERDMFAAWWKETWSENEEDWDAWARSEGLPLPGERPDGRDS